MAEVNIYGPIGYDGEDGITAHRWAEMVAGVDGDDSLTINVNSPGGSVFDGLTIYQTLVNRPGQNHIVIQGVAASIASVIAMAGDTITMGQASRLMIHNPMGPSALAFGTAEDLRDAAADTLQTADLLDSIRDTLVDVYAARTGQESKQLLYWMAGEKWLTAADAKKYGFADKVTPNKTVTARTFGDFTASVVEDHDELEQLAALAQTITVRTGPKSPKVSRPALLLARAKMLLTD